jgi:thiamine-phosphate pyrophosphorylase
MIIFRPESTDNMSALYDQINDAVARGIEWIQLPTIDADESQAVAMAEAVIPLCRDNGVILTLENNVEVVNRLHNHGVHAMAGSMHPAFIRERLGPHAIVGVQVDATYDFKSLVGVDVDYFTVGGDNALTDAVEIAAKLESLGVSAPIVVTGDYRPSDIAQYPAIRGILRNSYS